MATRGNGGGVRAGSPARPAQVSRMDAARRTLHFALLTLSLAGSQVVWSLELAYGTPYLLSIGLSKEATGYVWIAGPLSGLVVQPVLGSLSDSSPSRFRRRKYMLGSALVLAAATCVIAFSHPLATLLADAVGTGLGDWDPVRHARIAQLALVLSVAGFWVLDFAVNGLQVISRALVLDNAGTAEQNAANAWHGRMLHVGNIVGYWCGWVDLASWPALGWLGGGQFRKFAVVSVVCMLAGVCVTCYAIPEASAAERGTAPGAQEALGRRLGRSIAQVWGVAKTLPRPVRRVCVVQLVNTMGWFPFLFYGTTYVVELARRSAPNEEAGEERGSFAMLLFALLSLFAGLLIPVFSTAGRTTGDAGAEDAGAESGEQAGGEQGAPAAPAPWRTATLRTIWTLGTLVHAAVLCATPFVHTVRGATVLVMLMGVPWAISSWVPYAMIGEFVREAERGLSPYEYAEDYWYAQQIMERSRAGTAAPPNGTTDSPARKRLSARLLECSPSPNGSGSSASQQRMMSGSYSSSVVSRGVEVAAPGDAAPVEDSARGGTILGIHNLAIVLPQFAVSLLVSLIFRLTGGGPRHGAGGGEESRSGGSVTWVLTFGGVMALGAALLTRLVPLTMTERQARYPGYTSMPTEDEAERGETDAPPPIDSDASQESAA